MSDLLAESPQVSRPTQIRWWLSVGLVAAAGVYTCATVGTMLSGGRPGVPMWLVFAGFALMGLPSLLGRDRSILGLVGVAGGLTLQITALAVGWKW